MVKCSCKPPEKTTTLLPPVITTDNNLITAHRIGWIIWTHQIIKKMRYQIYEAKSVKHDAQQRVGIIDGFAPRGSACQGLWGFRPEKVISRRANLRSPSTTLLSLDGSQSEQSVGRLYAAFAIKRIPASVFCSNMLTLHFSAQNFTGKIKSAPRWKSGAFSAIINAVR